MIATCPECGGTDRRLIAPGYYECISDVLRDVVRTGSQAGAAVSRPCGHRYQAHGMPAADQCECGMFAVGRCKTCDRPVCGDHGDMFADSFLCQEHRDEALAATRPVLLTREDVDRLSDSVATNYHRIVDRRYRELVRGQAIYLAHLRIHDPARVEEYLGALQEIAENETLKVFSVAKAEEAEARFEAWASEARAALRTSRDHAERVVRVVSSTVYCRSSKHPPMHANVDAIDALLPGALDSGEFRVFWDHDTIQTWFLQNVRTPPNDEIRVTKYTRWGNERKLRFRGWWFPFGSTEAGGYKELTAHYLPTGITEEGARVCGVAVSNDAGFNSNAIRLMADLCGLEPLPNPPSLYSDEV